MHRVQVGEPGGNGKGLTITTSAASNHSVTDWKLYIIQEYCDAGSLRTAILKRKFIDDRKHCPRLVRAAYTIVCWDTHMAGHQRWAAIWYHCAYTAFAMVR